MKAPKPASREGRVSLLRYARLFRRDILSAQPERLYRAWMAEFRTPFFRSYLANDPKLIRLVLRERPEDFPKSRRVTAGLAPLLGRSVFVTNGEEWARQRRIIDPAFEGGRVKDAFPAMLAAAGAASHRLKEGEIDLEPWASHATADVIFRTLFSRSIEEPLALETFRAFRDFQRAQPVLTPAALIPGLPVMLHRRARRAAEALRARIGELVAMRAAEIEVGTAPDDLATKIMTTADPETGERFGPDEMVDQVAIFFLAGHETSAALLGWVIWLCAASGWQGRVASEAMSFMEEPAFSGLSAMPATRNAIREALRLYPPVPMMVRETAKGETLRGREVREGSQIVISPWHVQRHSRLWDAPDDFDPARWERAGTRETAREAYLPFSAGPRACPGAGFAMAEAAVMLAAVLSKWRFDVGETPVPVAHLTVRARDGIRVRCERITASS